jgi:hypothetical protein
MREIRQSGSEGGVARKRHPYPYVRLRVTVHRGRKSLTGGASRRVTESNCVVATRGGEQLEVNG